MNVFGRVGTTKTAKVPSSEKIRKTTKFSKAMLPSLACASFQGNSQGFLSGECWCSRQRLRSFRDVKLHSGFVRTTAKKSPNYQVNTAFFSFSKNCHQHKQLGRFCDVKLVQKFRNFFISYFLVFFTANCATFDGDLVFKSCDII